MAIHAAIKHSTGYKYNKPISVSPQIIRLRPAPHARTPILAYSLKITPANHFINWQQDPFGNYLARIVFPDKITEFKVDVEVVAEMKSKAPSDTGKLKSSISKVVNGNSLLFTMVGYGAFVN
jgi:transglutaminase-like putative cysteine protease